MARMRQLCKDRKGEHSKLSTASARVRKRASTRSRSSLYREAGREQSGRLCEAGLGFYLRQGNWKSLSTVLAKGLLQRMDFRRKRVGLGKSTARTLTCIWCRWEVGVAWTSVVGGEVKVSEQTGVLEVQSTGLMHRLPARYGAEDDVRSFALSNDAEGGVLRYSGKTGQAQLVLDIKGSV